MTRIDGGSIDAMDRSSNGWNGMQWIAAAVGGMQDKSTVNFGGISMEGLQPKFGGSPSPGFGGGFKSGGILKSSVAFGMNSSMKAVPSLPGFDAGSGPLKGIIDSGGFGNGGMPSTRNSSGSSKISNVRTKASSPLGTASTGQSKGFGLSLPGFGGGYGSSAAPGMMKGKQSSTFGGSSSPGFGAGGGMQDKSTDTFGGVSMEGMQPRFSILPSLGFGGGFKSGGVLKLGAAFGMDSSMKAVPLCQDLVQDQAH